jgi:hypothetical protein
MLVLIFFTFFWNLFIYILMGYLTNNFTSCHFNSRLPDVTEGLRFGQVLWNGKRKRKWAEDLEFGMAGLFIDQVH